MLQVKKINSSDETRVSRSHPLFYLSPDALVLFGFQEVEQHLQKGGVLAVRLHHIPCAGHLLAQRPQRHLVDSRR